MPGRSDVALEDFDAPMPPADGVCAYATPATAGALPFGQ
jgi:hypothetical protein